MIRKKFTRDVNSATYFKVILLSFLLLVKNKKSAPIKGKSIRDERIGKFIILILKKLEELKNQVTLQMRTGKYTRSEIYLL